MIRGLSRWFALASVVCFSIALGIYLGHGSATRGWVYAGLIALALSEATA